MSAPTTPRRELGRRRRRRLAAGAARLRAAIRTRPWLDAAYRVTATVVGALVVLIGLILVPLPGPGWLIVFFGLAILGSEFHWARRLLGWARATVARGAERWRSWRAARRAYGT
ncbi:TIGR02611 family protein [Leucobacter japonicus]|uniref:TIGR02611 family protein n=1 Tax=Leucobacter japonicus TaxID=1461259 RepID=UPI0006A7B9BF|nr:TIGR02611 family protein [Leucobacter japonicus]